MNKALKNAVILTSITLISGILLGLVYEVTKEPIALAMENAKQKAYKAVLSEASSFEDDEGFDSEKASVILDDAGFTADDIFGFAAAKDENGNDLGCVVTVVSHEGCVGDIKMSVGILNDGTVEGIEILEISETPGLGMKSADPEFKAQFKGKKVPAFICTKKGEEGDEMIDAISGATITTNAVINAVNSAIVYFKNVSGGGAGE